MRTLLICLISVLGTKSAFAKRAPDVVVTAELIRATGGPPCGVIATVIEAEFRVIAVEKGQLKGDRIVVEILCPFALDGFPVSRLQLSRKDLDPYRPFQKLKKPPAQRLYLMKQTKAVINLPKYLGHPVANMVRDLTRVANKGDRITFGASLVAQVDKRGRVIAIEFPCVRGFLKQFDYVGVTGVVWKKFRRRAGFSTGAFTAAGDIVGSADNRGSVRIAVAK